MTSHQTTADVASTGHPGVLVADASAFTWCEIERRARVDLSLDEVLALMRDLDAPVTPTPIALDRRTAVPDDRRLVWTHPLVLLLGGGSARTFLDRLDCWVELNESHLAELALLQGGDRDRPEPREAETRDLRSLEQLVTTGIVGLSNADGSAWPTPLDPPGQDPPSSEAPGRDGNAPQGAPLQQPSGRRWRWSRRRNPSRTEGDANGDGRVPVHSFWATDDGPPLGVAAVVAFARVHDGGRLNESFDLRRMDRPARVLASLASQPGPAVLLCGHYEWSMQANLAVAAAAQAANAETLVVHGGPSTPIGSDDCEAFLRSLPPGNIAVVGEGEITFADLLDRLTSATGSSLAERTRAVAGVPGARVLVGDDYVEGPARARHDRLEDFPSPFASGELELVPICDLHIVAVETNRGCPYSCSFCDWGSATMSRVRSFPMERVRQDLDWLMARDIDTWYIADANFGILPRDVSIAEMIAERRMATGYPRHLVAFPAKNSTDRYLEIMDTLTSAGIAMKAALALQTRDADTLVAVRRANIRTESYDRLAAESRRRSLPLLTELMIGLPGSTVESLKEDLQWCMDRQIRAFLYPTVVLPNSPMNSADYRLETGMRTDGSRLVETSSYSAQDRAQMDRITAGYHSFEVYGTLRPVLRYLQWDHGLRSIDVIERIVQIVDAEPSAFPLLAFHLRNFEDVLVPPVGWGPALDEARDLLVLRLGVTQDRGLSTAFAVTRHLLMWPGRSLPARAELEHDYVAYHWSARQRLVATGAPGPPDAPLTTYPPGELVVTGDPLEVDAMFGRWYDQDPFQHARDYEIASPLAVYHSTQALDVVSSR